MGFEIVAQLQVKSEPSQAWRALLRHFYDPFPTVPHHTATELQ